MSDQPTVCAIMLTRDRRALAAKAVECFRRQTYENKRLFIWNTGDSMVLLDSQLPGEIEITVASPFRDLPIGTLRNQAAKHALSFGRALDIFVHFDDDDWSHPNRITEQVALLQASGADVVGYSEMLFWWEVRTTREEPHAVTFNPGEAWLYTNTKPPGYALGTSLCYWRKTWEAHHFPSETQGVEEHWLREKRVHSVTAFYPAVSPTMVGGSTAKTVDLREPRMIARIHAGNTSNGYRLEEYAAKGSREWRRVPEWDARVRELLG